MPAEAPLEGSEHRWRHRREPRLELVFVLQVFVDPIREDVRLFDRYDGEQPGQQPLDHLARVEGRDRAAGLGLGLIQPLIDHDRLPGIPGVEHDPQFAILADHLSRLLDDGALVGGVMDHAKRVDEVEAAATEHLGQLFGVGGMKFAVEAKCGEALPGQRQADLGQFDRGITGAGPHEIDGVGADPAADLQHPFARPSGELGKSRNVRLDHVFAGFDLVEVLPGPDRQPGMPDVARPAIPIGLNIGGAGGRGCRRIGARRHHLANPTLAKSTLARPAL